MLKRRSFNLSEKLKWWDGLTSTEKVYIYVGTASLMSSIRSNHPSMQASRAIMLIRHRFPGNPGRGCYIRESRQKLAINLYLNDSGGRIG